MRCAIMQPTYLSWAGYYNLIKTTDVFVFLDDVQFEARSWQNRNRIILNGCEHFLTVPVKKINKRQLLKDIAIDSSQNWFLQHGKTIQYAYSKHPFYDEVLEIISKLVESKKSLLAEMNMELIRFITQKMKIDTEFVLASSLNVGGARSVHLKEICQALHCDQYISPIGSREYLLEDGVFEEGNVELIFQNYVAKEYSQHRNNNFLSHMSIVDVIANLGFEGASKYIE